MLDKETGWTGTLLLEADTNGDWSFQPTDSEDIPEANSFDLSVTYTDKVDKVSAAATASLTFDDSGTLDTDPTVTLTVHDRDGEALGGFELVSIDKRHDYSKFTDITNVGDALSLEIERAPDSSFDISVVANPGVDVAAVDFSIVDENGIDNFELGSGLSGWSVTTNPVSSAVDKSIAVSAIGAANFADAIQAGSETVLASYSSSAQSDILLTGGKLGSHLQSEVHASARMTTTDTTGQASFDFSSENTVFVDTVHSYSNAFPNLHVSAQDALTLMRMQLGLEASCQSSLSRLTLTEMAS